MTSEQFNEIKAMPVAKRFSYLRTLRVAERKAYIGMASSEVQPPLGTPAYLILEENVSPLFRNLLGVI